jgi:ArsR family transcriptional regulator, lead/cadmium/zinc/bismuth-responsive transcriptional repressor
MVLNAVSTWTVPTRRYLSERSYTLAVPEPLAIDTDAVADAQVGLPHEAILDLVVEALETLGDPTRARLLYALIRRPLCVRDLALVVGVSESAVSHQLRLLRDRHLVTATRRAGNEIEYRIDDHHVAALFKEAEYHADHVLHGRPDHPYPGAQP